MRVLEHAANSSQAQMTKNTGLRKPAMALFGFSFTLSHTAVPNFEIACTRSDARSERPSSPCGTSPKGETISFWLSGHDPPDRDFLPLYTVHSTQHAWRLWPDFQRIARFDKKPIFADAKCTRRVRTAAGQPCSDRRSMQGARRQADRAADPDHAGALQARRRGRFGRARV